ncbi:MAG TPA: hypothetical protein VK892_07100 [Pyrinomonadaceae bacterium]|nr:hypothetical protein [Pyrinomonadaceae bacterium]
MDYPKLIENNLIALSNKNREIQELRKKLSIEECKVTLQILDAKDEQGKSLFPNETARNAAIKLELAKNLEYEELETNLLNKEQERAELLAKSERLNGEFKLFMLDKKLEIASLSVNENLN